MFDKNFFNRELRCSNCNKLFQAGDKVFVSLVLPSKSMMPVGVLDKVLSKHSEKVFCTICNKKG
ncbi:hypothetical protein FDZ14_29765 (plasmid) [Priestia megaterium]|uniref:Uncharacterized protein n=1 Tax=Priestia megaterium TaxID=1404 RepID=A0A6M6E3T8_PRIMG|nr:hypothetical protein FDZ14_29765 [Priestia megaterium]